MYYPPEIVDQVIEANNIVDVIGQYVKLTKKGSTYFGLCPFHNEKTPSFSVTDNGSKQMYYCFGCHKGGSVLTFLMKYENYSYIEAVEYLAKRAGIVLPQPDFRNNKKFAAEAKQKEDIIAANTLASRYFTDLLHSERGAVGLQYFIKRGLTEETIEKFSLGFADKYTDDLYNYLKTQEITDRVIADAHLATIKETKVYDFFFNRVMFPIMDERNRIVGFGGRVLGDGEPKYLNTPDTVCFKKSNLVYGMNHARSSREEFFILCEGNMDVISLHQAGFTNAVASLGTSLTAGHARVLAKYKKKVYLSYDGDGAGMQAALRAIPILKNAGLSVKVVDLTPYKDPDELIKAAGAEEYRYRLKKALNSLFFEVFMFRRAHDMNDPEEVTRFQNETAERLARIDDEFERENYCQAVSKLFHIPLDILKRKVKQMVLTTDQVEHPAAVTVDRRRNPDENSALDKCQSMVLSYLVRTPSFYDRIKDIISAEDFDLEPYDEMAETFFSQLSDGDVNIVSILNLFEDAEMQEAVTEKLSFGFETMTEEEVERAVTESVIRIRQNSIEKSLKETQDADKMLKLFIEKQDLNKLKLFGGY